MIKTKNH